MGTTHTTAGSAAKRAMDVPAGDLRAVEGNLFGGLGDQGAEVIMRFKSDPKFVERVQQAMLLDGYCEPPDHRLARDIFEDRFWGLPEWKRYFGITFDDKLFDNIPAFSWRGSALENTCPFNDDKRLGESFFCFLGLNGDYSGVDGPTLDPTGWKDFLENRLGLGRRLDLSEEVVQETEHTTYELALHWYVVSIDPVPGSHNRNFGEQQKLPPKGYRLRYHNGVLVDFRVPEMIEFVTSRILMTMRGIPFRRDIEVRCCDEWRIGRGREGQFRITYPSNDLIKVDRVSESYQHEKCVVHATLEPLTDHLGIGAEYQL